MRLLQVNVNLTKLMPDKNTIQNNRKATFSFVSLSDIEKTQNITSRWINFNSDALNYQTSLYYNPHMIPEMEKCISQLLKIHNS